MWEKCYFPKPVKKQGLDEMSQSQAEKMARGIDTEKSPHAFVEGLLKSNARIMPCNTWTRLPVDMGKWPRLKHVHSEPGFAMHSPAEGTTLSFAEQRKIRHK